RKRIEELPAGAHLEVAKIKSGSYSASAQAVGVGINDLSAKPCARGHYSLKAFALIRTRAEVNHLAGRFGKFVQSEASTVVKVPDFVGLDTMRQGPVGRPEEEKDSRGKASRSPVAQR